MTTLNDYIVYTRRLLHDANGNFWSDAELTDYVNGARARIVRDTGFTRTLQNSSVVTGQEEYPFSGLPKGNSTLDIINIGLYWGDTLIPMQWMTWTELSSKLRFWKNYNGRPIGFCLYGYNTFYIAPKPDQTYQIEVDSIVLPSALANMSDVDVILPPYNEPIPYYAAHTAKFKEQSYGEAEVFMNQYKAKLLNVLSNSFTRRLPSPYSTVS